MGSDINKNAHGDVGTDVEHRLKKIEQKLDVMAERAMGNFPQFSFGSAASRDDEIDLRELWNVIWAGKWIIIATTFVFAVASVFYALSLPNIYKAEALLAPAEENSGGGLAGLGGQFGGLASLAGVNFGGAGGGSDRTALALEVLKSRNFVFRFIKKHNLLVPLMAAKGWDRNKGVIIIDPDLYDVEGGRWLRKAKSPRTSKPSMLEAYEVFIKQLTIEKDKATSFVTVGFEYFSPNLAKSWVDMLIAGINEEIKAREVAEAEKSIRYLTGQLERTPIADMKTVFYELIEEQSKTVMFAEVRDEYVFKTVDSAVIPELKSNPKRGLILALGILLGGILGVLFVFINYLYRKSI